MVEPLKYLSVQLWLTESISFWGVFWIDASSKEHAEQSFSFLSRAGKVEPNERAAKSWLSSLSIERPWLLIIDNADDANFPVDQCFPGGESGTILITTRNPMLKVHGTVGPRYFPFAELKETESVELLLRAADQSLPWSQSTLDSAQEICKTLGYLPLALLQAGKTILGRLCTIDNYLIFFNNNWERIRKMRRSNEVTSVLDANAAIYSSYELIHDGLAAKGSQASDDALELLKVFSFFHRQRIRVDIFLRAALNPGFEISEQEKRERSAKLVSRVTGTNTTWARSFKSLPFKFLDYILKLGDRPVLPRMLSDTLSSRPSTPFDELRLREALRELYQMSLIFANPDPNDDSYSMHPAVHLWVRERPEMTLADQAVWCQAAATILTQAILLPPLGDTEKEEMLKSDLLPHVTHVEENERLIQVKFLENQAVRKRFWPVLQPRFDRNRAMQLVKFSLVYSQCGHLKKAEDLQLEVAEFAQKTLGMEHDSTMTIMLLLSNTYWRLGRGEEAADLQEQVLEACIKVHGKDDLKTLKITNAYGSSRWLQGRILEALRLHEIAYKGMKKALGENDVDTLRTMGDLGRAVGKDFHFTKAIKIQTKSFYGLRDKLGPSHLDTLIAMDNLAMAYYDRAAFGFGHPEDLEVALEVEQEVFKQRKKKLGREHFFTLWSGLNLARIRAVRGESEEALATFLPGHAIARRNLGETHFAVLFAKLHYGRILMYAGKYEEAEKELIEVIDTYKGEGRKGHPDRLLAMFSLIKCRNLLGKGEGTIDLLRELTEGTIAVFGANHAFVRYLLDPQNLSSKEPDYTISTPKSRTASWDINPSHTSSWEVDPQNIKIISKYGHIK